MPADALELLTPPVIVGLIAVLALVPPAGFLLWRQHSHWRRAEKGAAAASYLRSAVQAALETAPDGYFAWFHPPIAEEDNDLAGAPEFRDAGYCSRRLSVLLDLFRGMESTFDDVAEGFDRASQDQLLLAAAKLRDGGTGFQIELNHAASGRRIQARGLRAVDADGRTMADVVWMSDVTEGVAAVDTLTKETSDLKHERDLLKAMLEGVQVPMWLRDDDLSLIYCNRAYVAAVDAADTGDVVARGREIAPRVAVREARALAAAARASGETRQAPFHMVIDGSRRLMEVTESPVGPAAEGAQDGNATLFSDGSGRLTAGVAYDVTRQEELETRLKREAAAHADVLERLGTAIAIFGPDTRLIFFNTAYAKLWGLDGGWLIDAPTYATVLDALRTQRRLPEVADFPAYKEQELSRFNSLIEPREDVLHLPDGGTLRRVIAPHPMGGLLTTYEDVTDRLALERSYNTLIAVQRETIDNLQEAVAVFGADGQLRLANPAFAGLWRLSLEALREGPAIGAVVDAFRECFDDEAVFTRHRGLLLGALGAERQRNIQQGRVVRSDSSVLEFVCVPLPDGGVLFCYNDVSAPERVAQALRGRAEALTATDKLKTELITSVAGALTSPLASITQLAGRLNAADSAAALKRKTQDIINAATSLETLIADVIDLSAMEAGHQTLHLDSFEVRDIVMRVSNMTQDAARRRGLALNVACPADIGWMVGDATRIKQTLFHLVNGTLKTIEPGGVLTLSAARGGGMVTFSLSHGGAADGETLGLAVYLAKRIAQLHGGSLDTDTTEAGTTVVCRLPSGADAAEPRRA